MIRREAERYCPELPFAPDAASVLESSCDWYEDYRLVRISWAAVEVNAPVTDVYAFYAPGDFRPLDATGRTIAHLNKVGPLKRTPNTTATYMALRMTLELSAIGLTTKLMTEGNLSLDTARGLIREFGLAAADATLGEYLTLSTEVRVTWNAAHWEAAAGVHASQENPLLPEVIDRPPAVFLDESELPSVVQNELKKVSSMTIRSPTQEAFPLSGAARGGRADTGQTNRHQLWLLRRSL
ncbi:MAG: hypothetical protein ACRD3J_20675, partial [Thermoanaerobaculia bacterium]